MKAIEKEETEVESGMDIVEKTQKSFLKISEIVDVVDNNIQSASSLSQEIVHSAKNVVTNAENTAGIAKNFAKHTLTVAATTEEQLAYMTELSNSAKSLSNMSDDLKSLINKFNI